MRDAARFLPFWRALDGRCHRVEPAWWGAVVTDQRFPDIWDANYARVETADPSLTVETVEGSLRPALATAGAGHVHVVIHRPEEQGGLLAELSSRGDRLSWDVAMEHGGGRPTGRVPRPAEEVDSGDTAFWARFRESLAEFDITAPDAIAQLSVLERDVVLPIKRWYAVRERGVMAALAALVTLEGMGYLDHVITFPAYRGRGLATALVTHALNVARSEGLDPVFLMVEEGSRAIALYRRLGFREVGRIASTLARLS